MDGRASSPPYVLIWERDVAPILYTNAFLGHTEQVFSAALRHVLSPVDHPICFRHRLRDILRGIYGVCGLDEDVSWDGNGNGDRNGDGNESK